MKFVLLNNIFRPTQIVFRSHTVYLLTPPVSNIGYTYIYTTSITWRACSGKLCYKEVKLFSRSKNGNWGNFCKNLWRGKGRGGIKRENKEKWKCGKKRCNGEGKINYCQILSIFYWSKSLFPRNCPHPNRGF